MHRTRDEALRAAAQYVEQRLISGYQHMKAEVVPFGRIDGEMKWRAIVSTRTEDGEWRFLQYI